jgi:hypothetical protein
LIIWRDVNGALEAATIFGAIQFGDLERRITSILKSGMEK